MAPSPTSPERPLRRDAERNRLLILEAAGTDKASGDAALPYAFALYDLGVALNRSGNPSAAIPVLEERLKFDNQTQTVMAELRDAQAKAGVAPQGAGGNGKGNGKKDRDG